MTEPEVVKVDAGEFKKEWHNYNRVIMAACLAALIAVAGSYIYDLQWRSSTDEWKKNAETRLDKNEIAIQTLAQQVNTQNAQVNGRLGVIEERTGNMVDGMKRIETKIEKKIE